MVIGGTWLALALGAGMLVGRSIVAANGSAGAGDDVDVPSGPLYVHDILRARPTSPSL
jgi:hypothetical protein